MLAWGIQKLLLRQGASSRKGVDWATEELHMYDLAGTLLLVLLLYC